jgi:hypothetical protein
MLQKYTDLLRPLALKMEAVCFSETFIYTYVSTSSLNSEQQHGCLKHFEVS